MLHLNLSFNGSYSKTGARSRHSRFSRPAVSICIICFVCIRVFIIINSAQNINHFIHCRCSYLGIPTPGYFNVLTYHLGEGLTPSRRFWKLAGRISEHTCNCCCSTFSCKHQRMFFSSPLPASHTNK